MELISEIPAWGAGSLSAPGQRARRDARLQEWRRPFATNVGWGTDGKERSLQTVGMESVVSTHIIGLDRLWNGVLLYFEDGTIAFYPQTLLHAMATQVKQIDAEDTSSFE